MAVSIKDAPELTLLRELEPQYRVFFRNLGDTVLRRPEPIVYTSSKPARFWGDVFVYSGVPWWWILESLLLHVMVMSLWILLQTLSVQHHPLLRKDLYRSHITYYPPTFPASQSRPPTLPLARPAPKSPETTPAEKLRVAREQHKIGADSAAPPKIKTQGGSAPNLGTSAAVAPPVPFSATKTSRPALPIGNGSIVAPPPDIAQGSGRNLGLPQPSAVAPAPDVKGVSGRGVAGGPDAGVVGPPPQLPTGGRRAGDVNIGHSEVVGPAPQLPMHEQRSVANSAGAALGNSAGSVVGPPPAIDAAERNPSGSKTGSLGDALTQVVPPPPSLESGKSSGGSSRNRALPGGAAQVIAPAPDANTVGSGSGAARSRSLAGNGTQAIAPPPSIAGTGGTGGARRAGELAGAGNTVAPPGRATSNGGAGGNAGAGNASGTGAGANLPGGLLPGEIPNDAYSGAGSNGHNSGASGSGGNAGLSADVHGSAGMPENPQQEKTAPTQELPLRLISAALTLPSSSYFSNYEVYIAEMRLRKAQTQLIKLVYMSLPYQKRLTEYLQGGSRVYKLRVTRDPTCDETLMQMTWPEFDDFPGLQNAKESNAKLPCYRTTADDYRKAMDNNTQKPSHAGTKK